MAKIAYGLVSTGVIKIEERPAPLAEDDLQRRRARAAGSADRGEIEAVVRRAEEFQAAYPDRAEFALLAGRALSGQGRMRAATEALARAAVLAPLSPEAHFDLGLAAIRTGDLARAATALETFLRLGGNGRRREVRGARWPRSRRSTRSSHTR